VVPRQPRDLDLLRALGDNVRAIRAEAGISQERLAELSGLHRTCIGHVERGPLAPTVQTVVRIAQVTDHEPAQLMAGLRVHPLP
jgi:DNA-binding XRE family transcriptional regulator